MVAARSVSVLYGGYSMKLEYLVQISDIGGINGNTGLDGPFQFSLEQLVNRPIPTAPSPGRLMWVYREALQNGMPIHLYGILRTLLAFKSSATKQSFFSPGADDKCGCAERLDRLHQTNIRHPVRGC